ncbi:MAG TPA: hypothetical protein VIZ28_16850 [Chitinophagaceae bacterium]
MKKKRIILALLGIVLLCQARSQNTKVFTADGILQTVNESIPVYRIELRLVTAGGGWDGTDNEVYVQLNSNDNNYFLDYGRDDFGRNADQRFDIISESIRTIKDIHFIRFGVKKDDQWGFIRVELYLNNSPQPVFSKTYNPKVVINKYRGQNDKFTISSADLRSNASWLSINQNRGLTALPVPVKFAAIKSMVESMIGNQIHHSGNSHLQWGSTDDINTVWGDWVEGKHVNSATIHFDLDLEYAFSNSPDAEIDVDFDLVFSCENGNIIIKTANVKISCKYLGVDVDNVINFLNSVITFFGIDPIKAVAERYQNNFTRMFTIEAGANKCHSIIVGAGGDVVVF